MALLPVFYLDLKYKNSRRGNRSMETNMTIDKTYDYQSFDAQIQNWWATTNVYVCDRTSTAPLYTVDTPPPTISGSLHIGHVFSYTQTDIIARFKRLSGFNVFYPFGFDDNGLPTERFVEKKHGVSGYHMGRSEFIKLCSQESNLVAKEFESLWKRLGISADWTRTYSTISPEVQKIAQESFIDLYKKNYVYQKEEPALYCTTCYTSVAQAELEDHVMPSTFNDITFTAEDGSPLTIATTRPELLGSCVAIFFHPDDARYKHLHNTCATVPVFDYQVPIMNDTLVDPEKGTGLVMCCTFGDKNDIAWFKKYNLPYRSSIDLDGKWSQLTGPLAGLKVTQAREKIIELLQQVNALKNQRAITHPVNTHERCKKAIEYVVLKQWFLALLEHKQSFLKAAEKIEWFPSYMHTRYRDWVENLQWDWCLSRQRFYGIPFPAWYCKKCSLIKLPELSQLPIDPQHIQPSTPCTGCGNTTFTPDTDVMDTWNTSSLTPYICAQVFNPALGSPFSQPTSASLLPMSMRPQAHDIIRTWAFYTIVKTWMHHTSIPWESIVISGHVLSSERDKISKSRGNSPTEPENLLKVYPADAIRYWTASGALGTDIAFSENQLKIGIKLQTKLWNAFRFIKEHIHQTPTVQPAQLGNVNEWIVHRISETFTKYHENLERNEFGHALGIVETFFWHDLCDNYLEMVKDQLFNPDAYPAEEVEATRWTLAHIGLRVLQLFAPYMPHVTEHLYQSLFKKGESLHRSSFTTLQTPHSFPESVTTTSTLIDLIGTVRKLKSEHQLSLKSPLQHLIIHSKEKKVLNALETQALLIKGVTHAVTLTFVHSAIECSSLSSTTFNDHLIWKAIINCDDQLSTLPQ